MKGRSPHILLADDDIDDRELLVERFLEQNPNVGVETFDDGHQLLTHLQQRDPADLPLLIILDYKMPVLTGAEVLQAIERDARYKDIPKIVWSTSNNKEYINRCIGLGADKYFTKPASIAELDKMIGYLSQLIRLRLLSASTDPA
jgi:CheY-like chemotaxis protein